MKDDLGTRMKENYENRYRISVPRRTNIILRIDGKTFHSYTRDCERPYDTGLMSDMDETAVYLCQNIQGAKLAYIQSDEISILLTDYETITTDAWFDNNIQKMVSVSASLTTAKFNQLRLMKLFKRKIADSVYDVCNDTIQDTIRDSSLAQFDSRVVVIPDIEEVVNYFIWRQQDATRNSIQMAGQANFSSKSLHGLSCNQIQEKLFTEKSINWNDYPESFRRGRCVVKRISTAPNPINEKELIYRSKWIIDDTIPIFTQNRDYIKSHSQKAWSEL